jgi:hypothetical protein
MGGEFKGRYFYNGIVTSVTPEAFISRPNECFSFNGLV